MDKDTPRYRTAGTIILFYVLPILLLSGYSTTLLPLAKSWRLLMFALVLSIFGAVIIYWLLDRWEKGLLRSIPIPQPLPQPIHKIEKQEEAVFPIQDTSALEEELQQMRGQVQELTHELGFKNQQIQQINEELLSFSQQSEGKLQELELYKKTSKDQLTHQESLLNLNNQTIIEQQAQIEKKQQHIVQLETKIRDLNYEIKTLLHLAEVDNHIHTSERTVHEPITKYQMPTEPVTQELQHVKDVLVHNVDEASVQLRRCLDIAQKLTSAVHYGMGNSRLRDLPVDNYALDFRRLSDSLRSENNCTILLFSQKEGRLLFVNDIIRNLLGWTPEKFIQTFSDIVQPSADVWREGLVQLYSKNEVRLQLVLRNKSGEETSVHALMGAIPTGVFRNHFICVLYK